MDLNSKLSKLNPNELSRFNDELLDRLYDRQWCLENGISYVNPDVSEAKEKLYSDLFEVL